MFYAPFPIVNDIYYYKSKQRKCTEVSGNFSAENSENIFALPNKKNEAKTSICEKKRGIEKLNQKIEKIFEKPLDNGIFLWYNLTRSAKEIGWYRRKTCGIDNNNGGKKHVHFHG